MIIVALLLSFFTAIYLFVYSFIIEMRRKEQLKRNDFTLVFSIIMAFIFSGLAYLFI